jgi:hypothetical protein
MPSISTWQLKGLLGNFLGKWHGRTSQACNYSSSSSHCPAFGRPEMVLVGEVGISGWVACQRALPRRGLFPFSIVDSLNRRLRKTDASSLSLEASPPCPVLLVPRVASRSPYWSVVCCLLSVVCCLLSVVCCLLSFVFCLFDFSLLSFVCLPACLSVCPEAQDTIPAIPSLIDSCVVFSMVRHCALCRVIRPATSTANSENDRLHLGQATYLGRWSSVGRPHTPQHIDQVARPNLIPTWSQWLPTSAFALQPRDVKVP